MAELHARVLSNVHLPVIPGFSIRTFGKYLSESLPGPLVAPSNESHTSPIWRAEFERRNLAEILPLIPNAERPDILLISSPEYLPIPLDIADFQGLKILLITDWNVCLRFLPDICPLFDFCFTDWPGYRLLKKSGVTNIHHQPLFGHDPQRFRCQDLIRDLEVSFCGNLNSGLHGERNRLLARLAKWGASQAGRAVHLRQAFDADYVQVLNRSKIVFNYSIRGEANMRLYESMATGAVAMVEESNQEVGILFQENQHFFRYAPGGLEERLDSLLSDPNRLLSVASAARDAVAQHTKSQQFQNLLELACRPAPLKSAGGKAPLKDTEAGYKEQKAVLKLRVLGAGYTLVEALEEIQLRSQEYPGLAREALPATLLSVLTSQPGEPLHAAERMLLLFLSDPLFPEVLREFFSLKLALNRKQWMEAVQHATQCIGLLSDSLLESESVWTLYGYFYPPIGLGKGFNSDLNLAYKQDLVRGKPQGYLELLVAHCCVDLAKAFQGLGMFKDSVAELQRPLLKGFASLDTHRALLSNLFEVHDREGILKVTKEWFSQYPLDTGIWDPIYHAYVRLGTKALTLRFLQEIETLAGAFLNADQSAMIRVLLQKEQVGSENGS